MCFRKVLFMIYINILKFSFKFRILIKNMFIIYIVCCIISSAAASTQIHSDFQLCQKGNCITIDTIQVPRKVSRCTKDFLVGFYLENTFTLGFLIKNNTLVRKSEEEICSPYTTTYAFSSFVATRVGN